MTPRSQVRSPSAAPLARARQEFPARQAALATALFCLCAGWYLFWTYHALDEILMGDELISIGIYQHLAAHGTFPDSGLVRVSFDHPPLMYLTYGELLTRLGVTVAAARLLGVFSVLGMGLLIFYIARRVNEQDGWWLGVLAWAVICANPFTVHGSLLPDMISTYVPLFFLAAVAGELRQPEENGLTLWWRTVVIALMAWTHLFSAILLGGAYLIEPLVRRWHLGRPSPVGRPMVLRFISVTLGWLAFLASWAWFCKDHGDRFALPFKHLAEKVLSQSSAELTITGLAQNAASVVAWVTPWYALMALAALWACWKKRIYVPYLLILLAVANLAVYSMGGGAVTHGVPKYHYSIVSLFALLIAAWGRAGLQNVPGRVWVLAGAWALIFLAIQLCVIGDPIYAVYYQLREAALAGAAPIWNAVTRPLAWKYLLVAALLGILAMIFRRYRAAFLLACYLGSATGMLWLQFQAPYMTNYCYGGDKRETEAVLAFLRRQTIPLQDMMLTADLYHHLGWGVRGFMEGADSRYRTAERFLPHARKAALIVIGLPINSVTTYQTVLGNAEVQRMLAHDFDRITIGSYFIWIRKNDLLKQNQARPL
ncbi:MAG: hypothetical protein HYV35_00390 [Lentisphaerae bacterium]|nr:hypothetical protein [Lentisphaerota bacterium]